MSRKKWKYPLLDGAIKLLEEYPKITFIDSHVHFNLMYQRLVPKSAKRKFDHDKLEVMKDFVFSRDMNKRKKVFSKMEYVITIWCEPASLSSSFSLYKDLTRDDKEMKIYTAFGLHPHEAKSWNDTLEKNLLECLKYKKTVALGEIGLDYHYNNSPQKVQKKVFEIQLKMAVKLKLPVVIHSREAEADTLEILQKHLPKDHFFHVHCFTSNDEKFLKKLLSYFSNCYIGFTGILTYNSTKDTLQKIAKLVPLNRILLESDGPYLPVRNKKYIKSGRLKSHMLNAPFVGLKIAEIFNEDYTKVMNQISKNTKRMYNIQ